ncbi:MULTISPECIES: FAD-binding oxidoreductase [Streptomyces]|uniref:FAD-binding protein n=1 Tax=Streptomyces bugieae TaxID=3098223 RepID=A0ABU7NRW6_9ACTN|nr:FAD-binding protein [Streptomyces nigrescens]MEE4421613.1 FAD-binding protein [Streptomyces sp. DSM 41528]
MECDSPFGGAEVVEGDIRYQDLASRGRNSRFVGHPGVIHVVGSAEQTERVVQDAVRAGRRIAVRSGGHCYENFVDDPAVQVLLDVSEMAEVRFDERRSAFAVESGATLGQLYRTLFLGWGVTVPGGACPDVGVGGHVTGGGYGPLSRQYGLAVDHLHAVEVVVVDASGRAHRVTATGAVDDPNRELWWAHTGGGGGNFGIVTRYWFRSPHARGTDPAALLPRPPGALHNVAITWEWDKMSQEAFRAVVRRYGQWHQSHAGSDSPYADLASGLTLGHREAGPITVNASLDAGRSGAARLLDRYAEELTQDLGIPSRVERSTVSWLRNTLSVPQSLQRVEFKTKAGFLRRPWTDGQVDVIWRFLNQSGGERWGTAVTLTSVGGRMNSVPSTATAMPHRDALFSAVYETCWGDPRGRDGQLAWIRGFYRDLFSDSGGVPVPDDRNGGAYINYPDTDLADPQWNTSGVPWHALYYGDNYRRLQRAKKRWDPLDVFRHALSVERAG